MSALRFPFFALALLGAASCLQPAPETADDAGDGGGHDDGGALAGDAGVDAGGVDAGWLDAGVTDAGTQDAGTSDAGTLGEPIVAPADVWTWVDFPESKCASGTATGLGVNPHPGATEVLIYLEGGGACANAQTCWGPVPAALFLSGFNALTFSAVMKKPTPLFDRTNAGNPLRGAAQVFVPYCTGDMHAGGREADLIVDGGVKPTYFWGARDLELFLARLAPTFPAAQRIVLAGASAGGFGTVLAFDQVRRAFHGARVDLIDDSGPSITAKGTQTNAGSFTAWGFVPPAGCAPCTSHREVLASDRASQPNSRFALLSYAQDSTIAPDFGYTLAEYPAVLSTFMSTLSADPNAAAFIVTGVQDHVVEGDAPLIPTYMPWLTQMLDDDPAWASVTVAHP